MTITELQHVIKLYRNLTLLDTIFLLNDWNNEKILLISPFRDRTITS